MVERKNLVTIFVSVLIILGIIFFISFSDEFKHALQGAAFGSEPLDPCAEVCFSPYENDDGGMADDDGDGHEQDWLFAGHCSRLQPWFCPSNPEDGECGILIENCDRCGCLHSGYVCNIENKCSHYCSGHWDCDADEICIDVNWELVNILEEDRTGCYADGYGNGDSCGMCRESTNDDGFCASEYLEEYGHLPSGDWETCLMDVADCGGKEEWEGGCPVETECLPMEDDPNYGECSFLYAEDLCTDGTPFGECSDLDAGGYGPPMYCNPDTGLIIPMCAGADEIMYNEDDCGCPEPDGDIVYVCTEPDPDMGLINWECEGTNYEVGQKPLLCGNGYCDEDSEEPWFAENCENCPEDCCPTGPADDDDDDGPYSAGEVNYCTQVGGVCAESCDSDYYILEDTEDYSDLHEACRDKDEDYVCCYPYANDELNDCEYYGGECKEECSGDYYHSEVPYLDDECLFYSDSESLCCLKYEDTSGNEGDSESGEEDASLWENLFGSPETNEDDPNYDEAAYIHLGENISLHRNYVFVGVIIIIVLAFAITVYYPKFKKK